MFGNQVPSQGRNHYYETFVLGAPVDVQDENGAWYKEAPVNRQAMVQFPDGTVIVKSARQIAANRAEFRRNYPGHPIQGDPMTDERAGILIDSASDEELGQHGLQRIKTNLEGLESYFTAPALRLAGEEGVTLEELAEVVGESGSDQTVPGRYTLPDIRSVVEARTRE